MNLQVIRVPPEFMIARWESEVGPFITSAMPVNLGRYQAIDILASVIANAAQAWAVLDDTELLAICVTKIDQYPRRRGCSIFALGGKKNTMGEWFKILDETLTTFALANGCDHFEFGGRPGWSKALGFEPRMTFMVKDLTPNMTRTLDNAPMDKNSNEDVL